MAKNLISSDEIIFIGQGTNVYGKLSDGLITSSDESAKDFITVTPEEYESLKSNGKLVPNTLYNVQDDAGSVIESGSNENGEWIKYTDGRMVCTYQQNLTGQNFNTAYGSVFRVPTNPTWNFPQPFIEAPKIYPKAFFTGVIGEISPLIPTNSSASGYLYAVTSGITNQTCGVNWLAIGRWK